MFKRPGPPGCVPGGSSHFRMTRSAGSRPKKLEDELSRATLQKPPSRARRFLFRQRTVSMRWPASPHVRACFKTPQNCGIKRVAENPFRAGRGFKSAIRFAFADGPKLRVVAKLKCDSCVALGSSARVSPKSANLHFFSTAEFPQLISCTCAAFEIPPEAAAFRPPVGRSAPED